MPALGATFGQPGGPASPADASADVHRDPSTLCEGDRPDLATFSTSVDNVRLPEQTSAPRAGESVIFLNGDYVANTKSAEKAARQAEKHRARNVALRSRMRTAVRDVTAAIAGGNKQAAQATYKEAVPVIDTLVNKQIIHRNKAARHKSRLAARIRAMA
jgi:small subunit ribosomal protein S20